MAYEYIEKLARTPKFTHTGDEITAADLQGYIKQHTAYKGRYDVLERYYLGIHDIINREIEEGKPNNKPVENYPQYITDVKVGYFAGKPITYQYGDDNTAEIVQTIFEDSDVHDEDSEIAKQASIFGHTYEMAYINEDKQIRFKYSKPHYTFIITDQSIEEKPIAAVRYYKIAEGADGTDQYKAEVYDRYNVTHYTGDLEVNMAVSEIKPHYMDQVPIVEFKNNEERLGDFETILSLVDMYEITLADAVNETNYAADAYLVIKNMIATDADDLQDMKNNRVISLDENGTAEWLTKQINDTHTQNLLDRIDRDVHKFSKTPSLDDEKFAGNLAGVAIKYKLWGLEQDAANKERKFKKALMQRLDLIASYMKLQGSIVDVKAIKPVFTRNIPQNLVELVQMTQGLAGIISQETALSMLPFIDDVEGEMEKIVAEKEENMERFTINPPTDPNKEDPNAADPNATDPTEE